jgi:hypothetical protein
MKRDYYELPEAGMIMRSLWKCAGGDRYLLERATYSDQVKYMCLGGVVFATGFMAALSGGYAFYTIFSPKTSDVISKVNLVGNTEGHEADITTVVLSVIFGIIWGLIIFNIDKFIVTSTGKGDGTEKITIDEMKGAIPRLIMGIIIGITISKPVEIRMFQTEIDLAVQKEQEKEKNQLIKTANFNYETKVKELKSRIGKLQDDIDVKKKQVVDFTSEISAETTGKNGNGAAFGPRAQQLERQKIEVIQQIKEMENTSDYRELLEDRKKYEKEKQFEIKQAELKGASLDGLLIRMQKAHEIAGWEISLFITLLFLSIELTPIFFKMMLTKTTYDYLAENRDELIKAENGIEVKYDYYKDKKGIERHLIINHEAEKTIFEKRKLVEIQRELNEYALQKYKEMEMKRIDSNPENIINRVGSDKYLTASSDSNANINPDNNETVSEDLTNQQEIVNIKEIDTDVSI